MLVGSVTAARLVLLRWLQAALSARMQGWVHLVLSGPLQGVEPVLTSLNFWSTVSPGASRARSEAGST